MKSKQTMRYTDEELAVIKSVFSDNEELLRAIRKVFLQMPLSAVEQAMIIGIKGDKGTLDVIRKAFLPTIDGDAPFNQVIDLWMTIEIKNKDKESVLNEAKARAKLISYIEQQLSVLEDGGKEKIKLNSMIEMSSDGDEIYQNLTTRNSLIQHTEMQLNMFEILAGQKTETVEETKKRLQKDSTK